MKTLLMIASLLISISASAGSRDLGPLKDSDKDWLNGFSLTVVDPTKLPSGPTHAVSNSDPTQEVCGAKLADPTDHNPQKFECRVCAVFEVRYPLANYPGLQRGDQLRIEGTFSGGTYEVRKTELNVQASRTGDRLLIRCQAKGGVDTMTAKELLRAVQGVLE